MAGHVGGGVLEITSELPEGKGLASSSADLVATVHAIATATGTRFSAPTIEALLRDIEPSDGVMYEGVVAFYHREVRIRSMLGPVPPLVIIAHDEGGQVDTIRHNRIRRPFNAADKQEYARLLEQMDLAITTADLSEIGRIATRSAEMNSKIRTRPGFEELRRSCAEIDGVGLILAHSGTMLGILLPADDPEIAVKEEHVRKVCAEIGGECAVYRSLPAADRLRARG
jgi:uncharacterized protein involved in propanediol utilization